MKQIFEGQMKQILTVGIFCGLFVASSVTWGAVGGSDKVFYRYTNNVGVKVVAQTIPPEFVKNGYDLVTISGDVIKSVPASPTGEDAIRLADARKQAKEQAKIDAQLKRTYSAPQEVEAAKTRALTDLRNNINILNASLSSTKKQLSDQEVAAANLEQSGKNVPAELIKNITTLRQEVKDLSAQIQQRETNYTETAQKYDQDKARVIELLAKPAP